METHALPQPIRRRRHLETFLSGMETQSLELLSAYAHGPLKPSLVEWKHVSDGQRFHLPRQP